MNETRLFHSIILSGITATASSIAYIVAGVLGTNLPAFGWAAVLVSLVAMILCTIWIRSDSSE